MDSENDLTAGLQRGVYSFRNLHLALAEETFADLDLYLIAERVNAIHRSDPVINPVFAPMFALAKVMKYENFNTQCKCIDIDSETEAEVIANEIASAAMDSNVAYRKGIRYVERLETFQPLDMEPETDRYPAQRCLCHYRGNGRARASGCPLFVGSKSGNLDSD